MMYVTDIGTFAEETEDQWLAHLTECYCHNIEHVPDEQQQELWLDICSVIHNIQYDPGLPWDLEICFDVSHELPVVVFTNENDIKVTAVFIPDPEDKSEQIENKVSWQDFYNKLSGIYQEDSESYYSQTFNVVLDHTFYRYDPTGIHNIGVDDSGQEYVTKNFKETLLEYMNRAGYKDGGRKDSDLYNKAGLSRQVFNIIINRENYTPSRTTIFQLIVALELSVEDAIVLLASAGLSFKYCDPRDCIIRKQIEKGNYNLFLINEILENAKLEPFNINSVVYE